MALWDLAERWSRGRRVALVVAHVDHGLRGRASRGDAAFVRAQAARRGSVWVERRAAVRLWARRHGRGLEEAGRILRYHALAEIAKSQSCRAVLAGHQLDDQVETVFLNLIRGAGPSGMAGMGPESPWPVAGGKKLRLLRPLLLFSRDRLMAYLKQRRLVFRKDASNENDLFFRNKIRPVLRAWETVRPGLSARVARLAEIQRGEEAYWDETVENVIKNVVVKRFSKKLFPGRRTVGLDIARLKKYHFSVQRRLLRRVAGFADFNALERARALANSSQTMGRLSLPGAEAFKKSGKLWIVRLAAPRRDIPLHQRARRRIALP